MKIIILIILAIGLAGAAGFFMLAQESKAGTPPGIIDGALSPCPASPNCVSSEDGTGESHKAPALSVTTWDRLPDLILTMGGRLIDVREDYLAAEFSTPVFGFVDDVEFRKAETEVHVRSASRVGHSDFGANRKRVEKFRASLTE